MIETKLPSIRSKQNYHIFDSYILKNKRRIQGFRHLWVLSLVLLAINKQELINRQNFQFPHNCHISQVSMLEGIPSPSKFLPGPASYSGNAGSPPLFAPMYHPLPPCLQLLLLLWISPSAVNTKIWQCKTIQHPSRSNLRPPNTIAASTVSSSSI